MKTLKFTAKEIRAIEELIWNHKACSSGCVYPEMERSRKDCDECDFTKSIHSISNKIEGE